MQYLFHMALKKSRILFALVIVVIILFLVIHHLLNDEENVAEKYTLHHHRDYKQLGPSASFYTRSPAVLHQRWNLAEDTIKTVGTPYGSRLNLRDDVLQHRTVSEGHMNAKPEVTSSSDIVQEGRSHNNGSQGMSESRESNAHQGIYSQESANQGIFESHSHASQKLSEPHRRAPQGISDTQKMGIKRLASNLLLCKGVPGMTIGIVKDNDQWVLPLGSRDLDDGSPITSKTKFFIGSVTKTFTAQLAALMIQESEGRLTWDTPLVEIMGPDFQLATAELTKEITLRDLLSHRSGLVSANLAVRASLSKSLKRADLLKLFHLIPVNSEPGKEFLYSNIGYTLAGAVIEHYWKRPWEDLVQNASQLTQKDFAKPYVPVDGGIEECEPKLYELGAFSSTGCLASSADDMIKWMKFILSKSKLSKGNTNLLKPDLLADMWLPNIQLSSKFRARTEKKRANGWPIDDINLGYGMGWFLNKYRGLRNFWHGGGLYSYYSLVWVLPEVQLGFFISINGYKGCNRTIESHQTEANLETVNKCMCGSSGFSIIESLAYFITDTLLQLSPWITGNTGCSYPNPWAKCGIKNGSKNSNVEQAVARTVNSAQKLPKDLTFKEPKINLNIYKGVYAHDLLGKVYIYAKDPAPELFFHLRHLDGILRFKKSDTNETVFGLECTGHFKFLSRPDKSFHAPSKQFIVLTFHLSNRGKAEALSIYFSEDEKPFMFRRIQPGRQ